MATLDNSSNRSFHFGQGQQGDALFTSQFRPAAFNPMGPAVATNFSGTGTTHELHANGWADQGHGSSGPLQPMLGASAAGAYGSGPHGAAPLTAGNTEALPSLSSGLLPTPSPPPMPGMMLRDPLGGVGAYGAQRLGSSYPSVYSSNHPAIGVANTSGVPMSIPSMNPYATSPPSLPAVQQLPNAVPGPAPGHSPYALSAPFSVPQNQYGMFKAPVVPQYAPAENHAARQVKRKHNCMICGKEFARPSALQTHIYSHTGEKPFVCEHKGCGRSFSVVSNLRRHRRVHAK